MTSDGLLPEPRSGKAGHGESGRTFRSASTWLNASIVGIQFPVAIAIGYFFGRFLDRHLATWPWLTILFSLFGIAAGFVNLFRITAQASRSEEDQLRPELGLKVYPPDDEEDGDEDGKQERRDGG
jgi:F0F1-type ATP synthase assembly protein I